MPFVRNPRDRNKQIETQQSENNALSKDLGTVGSVGGALLQDKAPSGTTSTAPTLSSPSPERKTAPLRATNLAEYGRANIGKTQALGQSLASRQASDVRDFNQRLAESGSRVQSSLDRVPDLTESKTRAEDYLAKAKEGTLQSRDYTNLRDAFKEYQGPETLSDVDPNLVEDQQRLAERGVDTQQGALGVLSQRVGDQSGYTRGVSNLDAALVGRQSQALQDTGRAAVGAGATISRADDDIRSRAANRAADLERLKADIGEQTKMAFGSQQEAQTGGFEAIDKKIKETQVDPTAAQKYIADAQADYNNKTQALQGLENEMNTFIDDYRLNTTEEYNRYNALASDPSRYNAYMSDADTHNTDWIGRIHIPTLADFRNVHLPKVQQFSSIVPNGAADVEQSYMKLQTAPIEARQSLAENYLSNFSDEELSRAGTSRDAVLDYARKNDLNLEETTGLLQRMGVQPDINTKREQQDVAALKYLAGLLNLDLNEQKETKASKEEGE